MSRRRVASLFQTGRSTFFSNLNYQTSRYALCSAMQTPSSTKAQARATHSGATSMAFCMPTRSFPMTGLQKETTAMQSQYQKILNHLIDEGSISGVEAAELYRVRSLPRRICDLKEAGFEILSEWRTDPLGQRYKKYFLA